MKDERCEGVIKNAWAGHSRENPMETLMRKVDSYRSNLQAWSKHSFGNIRRLLQ